MNKYELIIFDLDGTLVDSAPDVLSAANKALGQMRLPLLRDEQIKKAIGPSSEVFAAVALGEHNLQRTEEFFQIYRAWYLEHCADRTAPFAGIMEMLENLRSLKLAVASNKPFIFVQKILTSLSMDSLFEISVAPEMAGKPKPDPAMIHYILDRLNTEPEKALVVGDTDNDILAAQSAGVAVCAADWGYAEKERILALCPDFYIRYPSELTEFVRQRNGVRAVFNEQER
jgi:phosphoglycolate phosphatase